MISSFFHKISNIWQMKKASKECNFFTRKHLISNYQLTAFKIHLSFFQAAKCHKNFKIEFLTKRKLGNLWRLFLKATWNKLLSFATLKGKWLIKREVQPEEDRFVPGERTFRENDEEVAFRLLSRLNSSSSVYWIKMNPFYQDDSLEFLVFKRNISKANNH